jgi:hypothetical protein
MAPSGPFYLVLIGGIESRCIPREGHILAHLIL